MSDFYVPENTVLACNKGSLTCKLKATHYGRTTIYGEHLANEADKIPNINLMPMGVCKITRSACVPVPIAWQDVKEGVTVQGFRLLLDTSVLPCSIGGTISINFTGPGAKATINDSPKNANKSSHESFVSSTEGGAGCILDGVNNNVEGIAGMAKDAFSKAKGAYDLFNMAKQTIGIIKVVINMAKGTDNIGEEADDTTSSPRGSSETGVDTAANLNEEVTTSDEVSLAFRQNPGDLDKLDGKVLFTPDDIVRLLRETQ